MLLAGALTVAVIARLATAQALLAPMIAIALTAALVLGWSVLRWPWVGLGLLVASVPAQQAGALGGLTITRVCLALALVGYAVTLLTRRQGVTLSRLTLPFIGLLLWFAFTATQARNVTASMAEISRWSIAAVTFVLAVQFVARGGKRLHLAIVLVMALAGASEAAFGAVLGLLSIGPESFQVSAGFSRAFGTFGRPNTFAGYLEITLFPVLWLGLRQAALTATALGAYRRHRYHGFARSAADRRAFIRSLLLTTVLMTSSVVMLVGVGVSYSRGAWIGVAAGLAVSILFSARRIWFIGLAASPIALALAVALAFGAAPSALGDRVSSILDLARPFDAASVAITDDNFAAVERMAHWQAGWNMFQDYPIAGVGVGNFNVRYPDYFVRPTFRISQGHAHNYYIHTLAESGLIGLLLYVSLLISFLLLAARVALGAPPGHARALALGALGTTTALAVHNVFENLHVLNLGVQLSVTWALAIASVIEWRGDEGP